VAVDRPLAGVVTPPRRAARSRGARSSSA